MRIAIVSDIHGNLPALEAVLADIASLGVDFTVNLGDILSGPLWPRETVAWLAERAWPTIAGNHERQALAAAPSLQAGDGDDAYTAAKLGPAERAWLAALPACASRRPRLLLVGHEPDLGDLASALIGAPAGAITLRKSGLALLRCGAPGPDGAPPDRPRPLASLRLLLTPALLVGGGGA